MHDPRDVDTTPLAPPDVEPEEKGRQLEGEEPRLDQDAVVEPTEIDDLGSISDTEIYEGELEAGANPDVDTDDASLESLTARELRPLETDDPNVAAEEGETWVPPTDPPVVPDRDDPQGAQVAAGFGGTATEDPFDADHHGELLPADDEVSARVREALLADARTSRLADGLEVETAGGIVRVRGRVADVEDSDLVAEVASSVSGVVEVRDETSIPEGTGGDPRGR